MMDSAIGPYIRQGFRVTAQTPTSVNLVKPKKFSFLAFIALMLLGGIPGIVYLGWYLAKRDRSVYLYEENGALQIVDSASDLNKLWIALAVVIVTIMVIGMLNPQ